MEKRKLDRLSGILRDMGSAVLAYSGGVDSSFLLKVIKLAGIKSLAVTGDSETMPFDDLRDAATVASGCGMDHRVIMTDELKNEDFLRNTPMRCFHCKDMLFGRLKAIALMEGYNFVIDGSTTDDTEDFRPGRDAGIRHGVRSPLQEAGFTKQEIRKESKRMGLPTWDKPSSPCLGSRFPYGVRITAGALRRVSQAERFLKTLGLRELRVRHLGDEARIEIPEKDIARALDPEVRGSIVRELKSLGYRFVSLDLEGFRSGKMGVPAGGDKNI
ncbi:MAG: ATP-dependent sacrificial sulfur transferase LarE [Thermodesulfovibrionales bacterium]|nr:ATP-dependent sacrificial sulfur transferase LarE [Thermodesulfovibrionales bacterium]